MKKLFLFMLMVISLSIYATAKLSANIETNTCSANSADEKYEKIKTGSCVAFNVETGRRQDLTGWTETLYKASNSCYSYYLYLTWPGGFSEYCPVYKNEQKDFKGNDVSAYNYYAQKGNRRFFFFY